MNIKKITLPIVAFVVLFLMSCGQSIEGDAKKIAELTCKMFNESEGKLSNMSKIEKIREKYEGEEREKLNKLVMEYKGTDCD